MNEYVVPEIERGGKLREEFALLQERAFVEHFCEVANKFLTVYVENSPIYAKQNAGGATEERARAKEQLESMLSPASKEQLDPTTLKTYVMSLAKILRCFAYATPDLGASSARRSLEKQSNPVGAAERIASNLATGLELILDHIAIGGLNNDPCILRFKPDPQDLPDQQSWLAGSWEKIKPGEEGMAQLAAYGTNLDGCTVFTLAKVDLKHLNPLIFYAASTFNINCSASTQVDTQLIPE